MSNSGAFTRVLAISGIATALSVTGYAIYFDYQRRNNPDFRRGLKRKVKKQRKQEQLEKEQAKQSRLQEIKDFLKEELSTNPIPSDPTQIESVFAANVELGERLSMAPGNEMEAAAKFYKALTVYPKPTDLLGIYQRTISENIYELIVLMIAVLPPTNITDFISGSMGVDSLGIDEDEEPLISGIVQDDEDDEINGNEGIINTEDITSSGIDAELEIINDADGDETSQLADRIIEEFAEEVENEEAKANEQEETSLNYL